MNCDLINFRKVGVVVLDRDVQISFRSSGTDRATFDVPYECPHCGISMSPNIFYAKSTEGEYDPYFHVGLLLRCTNSKCRKYYALEYDGNYRSSHRSISKLIKYVYQPPIEDKLPAEIDEVSPAFKEIYNQSLKSEQLGLTALSGIGYRKSIEFLIKDYLINVKNLPDDEIKAEWLNQSINRIEFPNLKNLVKAATWIGNDETHYIKKWEDKDIEDMKMFIRSATLYISAEWQSIKAEKMVDNK